MLGLGPFEFVIILLVVLIIFGAGKLPQLGDALGKGIKNFKKASQDPKEQDALNVTPRLEKAASEKQETKEKGDV